MVTYQRESLPLSLHTPLLELLGCEVPVMNAGMGGVARSALAAAVCNAGGFGALGMVREPVSRIREEVAALRKLSTGPFAVNLIPAATEPALLRQQIDCCIELQVPAIALFWDVDSELIQELKQQDILVLHQVGSRDDAHRALRAGVDVLIAQGVEAGGHVRGNVSTLALVPELAALSPVPVVASGGIASGAGLVAAIALGAQGVSCGSLFLATEESNAHPLHQQRLCRAHAEDTLLSHRFFRNWPMAAAVRVLPNSVTNGEYDHLRNLQQAPSIAEQDGQAIPIFSTDSPLRDATGSISAMALYAGQSCNQIHQVTSVAERMAQMMQEACNTLSRLQPESDHPANSPAAVAPELAGQISKEQVIAALLELLAAERAGARVAAACQAIAYDQESRTELRQLHKQEVTCCRALLRCLAHLDAKPGNAVGDFYGKVMALESFEERMALIEKGQRWVFRRVVKLLEEVEDPLIRQQLEIVRRYHED
ncbi:nitronate monooxygenase [Sediminihaliea albiluteola]|nr:nitronate monooxygenase [Sediminihaliea albiluteola]